MFHGSTGDWKLDAVSCGQSPCVPHNSGCLPLYSTLERKYKPRVLRSLAVPHSDVKVSQNILKNGARPNTTVAEGEPGNFVRMVMPSAYARADMACPDLWSQIQKTALHFQRNCHVPSHDLCADQCVDLLPLVAARPWFYGPNAVISVETSDTESFSSGFAEIGDTVKLALLRSSRLTERIERCFVSNNVREYSLHLEGVVTAIWTVHHQSRYSDYSFSAQGNDNLPPRDSQIVKCLNFVQYKSPSDEVAIVVPPLPLEESELVEQDQTSGKTRKRSPEWIQAMRIRRIALKKKQIETERVWSSWKKPLIKPGDTIALLKPQFQCNGEPSSLTVLTEVDRDSRLCIVHRFWTEREERSRHLLFIDGGAELPGFSSSEQRCDTFFRSFLSGMSVDATTKAMDVRAVTIKRLHPNPRGPARFRPISSVGTLQSGEPYFIYRFLLFWDGFQITTGKQSSGDGLYLQCINLPSAARNSQHSVRILAQSPPGVNVSELIVKLIPDLIAGSTEGFKDVDGDGNIRRVFLDLVGVLGDTPALNEVLDVLGHTSTFCCHLCRFSRGSSTILGARYAGLSPCAAQTASRRGFYQHTAVRDCKANDEACRMLGIRPASHSSKLPLHAIRLAMEQCRSMTPCLADGTPLLPCILDPYRACLVAPDHLLTGHAKDCINLAYKLIPTRAHREACERSLKRIMHDAGLPVQNQYYDPTKKSLYSLSMTDIYAIVLVAEISLEEGLNSAPLPENLSSEAEEKIRSSISLVRSCARLSALLWHKPSQITDGSVLVCEFNAQRGMNVLMHRQEKSKSAS